MTCAGCFTHLLADARLRDEQATCPNCRVEISKTLAARNLAVEKAVAELPTECLYCQKEFPKKTIERHQLICEERYFLNFILLFFTRFFFQGWEINLTIHFYRISNCKYSRIGCPWRGPYHESTKHETQCVHPHRSGDDVMEALRVIDEKNLEERKLYDNVFDLLSYEKITFNGTVFSEFFFLIFKYVQWPRNLIFYVF